MRLIASYPTTAGPRQLITVTVPYAEHPITLLDIDAYARDVEACDAVIVDHEIDCHDEAHALAIDYMIAAQRADGPPERCDIFDLDETEDEGLDPTDVLPAIMRAA